MFIQENLRKNFKKNVSQDESSLIVLITRFFKFFLEWKWKWKAKASRKRPPPTHSHNGIFNSKTRVLFFLPLFGATAEIEKFNMTDINEVTYFSVDIQSCRFDSICEPSFVCTFFYPSNSKTSNVFDCGNTFDQKKIVSALFDL